MDQQRPIPTERLRTIRGQMVERFSLDELRDLTFDLGINWDQLSDSNLSARTTELLELLNRQTKLPHLLARLEALQPGDAWALDDLDESAVSPYKGLEFYDEADAGLFFGRERLTATLLDALRGQSFLAVVGASGSGKSSVVRAGVVPALKGHHPPPDGAAMPKDSAGWAYLELTPTDRPLEQLALTLTRDLDTVGETRAIIRDVAEDPAALHLYLRKYLERQRRPRAFLLVDQFEELFTLCKDEPARVAFIDGLLGAAGGGATTVVITLRADFYHHCLRYPTLRDALQQRQQLIGAMSEGELREAVELPARRTGYELEPGLADKIVRDAGDDAGALPLLSHALLETWRRREGRRLTHFGYHEAGGVGGAIARTAERAYGDLAPAQQAVARRILLQLTELGEGAEDTRRVVALTELLAGTGRVETEAVLDALIRARLVTTDDQGAKVQVTHEALIREWPALQEWLRDNREALRLERRLEAAATEWSEGGRDSSYLYDGAQLAAAREWAAGHGTTLSETMSAFLDAATAEEEREKAARMRAWYKQLDQAHQLAKEAQARASAEAVAAKEAARAVRTSRRWLVVAGVLLALAGVAAVLAILQGQDAVASEATAVAARVTSDFNQAQAEIERDNAIAARATSDFNQAQANIERNNAVTSLNDSRARLLLNQSESVFERDPLLANRLLLEAAVVAGSDAVAAEMAGELAGNLALGQTVDPITATVDSFTEIQSNTLYAVNYRLGEDSLISGATGALFATLSGEISKRFSIPDSPFFVVNYDLRPAELRRTDDAEYAVALKGEVTNVIPLPSSPFFAVGYFDEGELRRTDDLEYAVTLNGRIDEVIPMPNSPFFVVDYSNAPGELRRTDNEGQVITLKGEVDIVTLLPDSPFYVLDYQFAPSELRRTDDVGQVITLKGEVSSVTLLPNSSFFVLDYQDAPSELRRTDDEGQAVALKGEASIITPLPNSPFFVVEYVDASLELRRTDDEGRVVVLNGEVEHVIPMHNSPFFVVVYSDGSTEVRRTDDADWLPVFNGEVADVYFLPNSPFFVVAYSDAPDELRRLDNKDQAVTLNGDVDEVIPIPNSPFFVVYYSNMLAELRRIDNEGWAIALNGLVNNIIFIPDSHFFVVDYSYELNELRRTDNGRVVTDKSGKRSAESAVVLNTDRRYYWITFQDGTSEIASSDRALVYFDPGIEQSIYFPETNRVAVRYADGRVHYVDLNLIEALGGADAAETLAAMSPEELVAFTCKTLFSDNPDWDEARLDEYLDFLPDKTPRACRE